jgi:DNA-binding CsgD family transcriptional regulator
MARVKEQCNELFREGYSLEAIQRFLNLSIKTGKIKKSEADEILESLSGE